MTNDGIDLSDVNVTILCPLPVGTHVTMIRENPIPAFALRYENGRIELDDDDSHARRFARIMTAFGVSQARTKAEKLTGDGLAKAFIGGAARYSGGNWYTA